MTAFYNEFDKGAAAWLRELVGMNLIAHGQVDERSIVDVQGNDIGGTTRVHWFAGIGGWDYALQLAGWPADRPVWTASLPCQPFSCAGKQLGKADERHLLPHFLELVAECRPPVIFGEQVPGAIRHGWLDDLCDEMGREGYTVRAAVLTAAGIGAPHIRARLYWVAYTTCDGWQQKRKDNGRRNERNEEKGEYQRASERGDVDGVAHASSGRREKQQAKLWSGIFRETLQQTEQMLGTGNLCAAFGVVSHHWFDIEWLPCRDGKYRPIKPGIKPLVNGLPKGVGYSGDTGVEEDADNTQEARVMRLRGYGNAIVPAVAAEFIKAVMRSERKSALEDDADWLAERGYRLDVEEFSDWVTREWMDGWAEEEARKRVAEFMR